MSTKGVADESGEGRMTKASDLTKRFAVWLVAPAAFAVYLYTLSPTVGLIDSGELAAGCWLLNILHPTGYPLYTMLGRLATLVPLGAVVNRVAVLSAVLAAAGVGFFLALALRLGVTRTAAGVSAAMLAFSFPVWAVAVDVEVYSLTLVLAVLVWLAAERTAATRTGALVWFGYVCGLALTNHMTAVSVVLGAGVGVLLSARRELLRSLPVVFVAFLLGVSPYLFLVLRAKAGPLLSWGNPQTLERFVWHVTGRQYQVWMFSLPWAEVGRNALRGLGLLARSFAYVLVPVVLYGIARLLRRQRVLAVGLLASAVAAFCYAINYSIPDIESYYIPCVLALAVFGAAGLDGLARRIGPGRHLLWLAVVLAVVLNYSSASRRHDYVARDHAVNTLLSAEPNATIITDWWDFYSPAFYLQSVEGVRPDVCIIDKELVRRSWYLDYLSRAYPWLVAASRPELERYRSWLDQFEHGRLRDPEGIQRSFIALLESFITRHPDRPAYTTYGADVSLDARQMLPELRRVPVGLLFQLRADSVVPAFDYSVMTVRVPPHVADARTRAVLERYRFFIVRRGLALWPLGRTPEAETTAAWYKSLPVSRLVPLKAN